MPDIFVAPVRAVVVVAVKMLARLGIASLVKVKVKVKVKVR